MKRSGAELSAGSTQQVGIARAPLPAGELIDGRYRLEAVIGECTSGYVYRAHQLSLDRAVAVKILHPAPGDTSFAEGFRTEARIASQIEDPHSVHIIDFGQGPGESMFLVMELLTGPTLSSLTHVEPERSGSITVERACLLARNILAGLGAIHAKGIVHGDVKPDNVILVDGEGGERAVLIDFGIARPNAGLRKAVTKERIVAGTPGYIAPEVLAGEAPTIAADLYAAGVILFELLTGAPPFEAPTMMSLLQKHVCATPPAPSTLVPHLPARLDQVCERALSKRPEQRYATAQQMAAAIQEATTTPLAPIVPISRAARAATVRLPRDSYELAWIGGSAQQARLAALFAGRGWERRLRLVGDGGTGRTTLVERAAAGAFDDARIVRIGADPTRRRTLYYPIRALLSGLAGIDANCDVAMLMAALANRGIDELSLRGVNDLMTQMNVDGLAGPERRAACARAVVASVAASIDDDVILVFDDADCYDVNTRQIVAELADIVERWGARMVVVTSPGDALLAELPQLELEPLNDAQLATLAAAIGEETGTTPAVAELQRITEGNPARIQQLAHYLVAAEPPIPVASFEELIGARLQALPRPIRRLVCAAAVYGVTVPLAWLSSLALKLGADDAGAATAQLVRSRLLCRRAGATELRFVSAEVRELIYAETPAAARRVLHEASIDARAQELGGDVDAGWHALLAGRYEDAADRLGRAAELALAYADTGEALVRSRAAFEAARAAYGTGDEPALRELLMRVGAGFASALLALRRTDEATAALHQVCALTRSSRDPDRWSPELIEAWAKVAYARGHVNDAVEALRYAHRTAEMPGPII